MAVLKAVPDALLIDVDENGVIDLNHLEYLLKTHKDTAIVSVMTANNKTGVIQPLDQVVTPSREYGALVHSDAVQSFGKGVSNGLLACGQAGQI